MDAQIRFSGGDSVDEVADLYEWLRGERALAGAVQVVRRPPAEGELGDVVNTLAVALGSGGAGVALARSLTMWLQTRRSKVAITVETATGTVTVTADVDPDQVLPMIERVLPDHDV